MSEYEKVAWITGGSQNNLRTSLRHLAPVGASELQGSVPRVTLCGRGFKMSRLITPNDYWTDGDCQRCLAIAAKEEA